MSDEVFPTPTRQIDIPARFIRQAVDHIEHTGSRYVTFLFTGEQVIDAVCVGVTTRLLITDQRKPSIAPSAPELDVPWTVANLTNEVILAKMAELGSGTVRKIGDDFGLPGNAIAQRQRIRRVLQALTEERLLRKSVPNKGFPVYSIGTRKSREPSPTMPIRPAPRTRRIKRSDITAEKVLALFQQNGRMCSRDIGDAMEIPRGDASVRGKVSNVIHDLLEANVIRPTGDSDAQGGRIYEMIAEANTETVAEA